MENAPFPFSLKYAEMDHLHTSHFKDDTVTSIHIHIAKEKNIIGDLILEHETYT